MSYADARLDLTSVDVACLTGSNGAGKSALLDAVTWALWESGRSSSDELMRLGQGEMWVEVNFELEGQFYRVRRSRQKQSSRSGGKGSSKGTLELQVQKKGGQESPDNPGNAVYQSLSSAHVRETQQRISELLRMEYQTFVNSVYLKQGHADEFTTHPPAERKQILCDILGLSYFDRLQEQAREQCRKLKAQSELMEISLQTLPTIDKDLEQARESVAQVDSQFAEATEKVEFYESSLSLLKQQLQDLKLNEHNLRAGATRRQELQADIAALSKQEEEQQIKLRELTELFVQSKDIEQAAEEFEELKVKVERLDRCAMTLQDWHGEQLKLQSELAQIVSKLEVELAHWRSSLTDLEGKHAQLQSDTADRQKLEDSFLEFKKLLSREAELSSKQEAFMQLNARVETLQSQITEARIRLDAELQQKQGQLSDMEDLLKSTELLDEENLELKNRAETLDKLETEFELVEQKGLAVKNTLETVQAQITELKRRQNENLEKIKKLHEHADSSVCPLCSGAIVDRSAVIDSYLKENEGLEMQSLNLSNELSRKEAERVELRKRYTELRQSLQERKQLDVSIGRFNERFSAIERAHSTQKQLQAELQKLLEKQNKQDYAQTERESLIAVKSELHKLDFDPIIYANLQAQIRGQRHIEFRHQQLQKDLTQLQKLEQDLPAARLKVEEISGKLQSSQAGHELKAELTLLQGRIAELGYDRQEHQSLKEKLSQLIPSSELYRDLERARQEQPVVVETLETCRNALKSKGSQLQELEQQLQQWQQTLNSLPEITQRVEQLEPALLQHRQHKQELAQKVAVNQSQQRHLQEQREALEEQRKRSVEIQTELDDYTFLAEAFGKKGIQAVIIENAIPEIESEANSILSRLSDNQMHVALVTQHKTKSGSMVETLDLLIGDQLGTRNYELYSGGEAFKVDFAVRVALSRLLARRAGAKLETLIIDEGFGSQDELSRDRLVRAINSIRSDFARILVITHISEVKEMFPVQIHVSKQGGTSRVQVMS